MADYLKVLASSVSFNTSWCCKRGKRGKLVNSFIQEKTEHAKYDQKRLPFISSSSSGIHQEPHIIHDKSG
jgi:hypothetical protein